MCYCRCWNQSPIYSGPVYGFYVMCRSMCITVPFWLLCNSAAFCSWIPFTHTGLYFIQTFRPSVCAKLIKWFICKTKPISLIIVMSFFWHGLLLLLLLTMRGYENTMPTVWGREKMPQNRHLKAINRSVWIRGARWCLLNIGFTAQQDWRRDANVLFVYFVYILNDLLIIYLFWMESGIPQISVFMEINN